MPGKIQNFSRDHHCILINILIYNCISTQKIRNGLENGLKEQAHVRQTLLEKYRKGEKFFSCLDENVQRSVEKSFPGNDND